MKHQMGLQNKWFDKIESGEKQYELRLFDEKRQKIHLGDTIEFSSKDGRKLTRKVVSLNIYPDFITLFAEMSNIVFLMLPGIESYQKALETMEEFYPVNKQHKDGVVAIGLK